MLRKHLFFYFLYRKITKLSYEEVIEEYVVKKSNSVIDVWSSTDLFFILFYFFRYNGHFYWID